MKSKVLTLVLIVLCLLFPCSISADEDTYYLVDYAGDKSEVIDEFYTFNSAKRAFNRNRDDYDNLVVLKNEEVILMEYGIVEFKTNQGCNFLVTYEDIDNGNEVSLNGCYGIDAAYLDTVSNGRFVNFKVADTVGQTYIDNVILRPLESLNTRLSSYIVTKDKLNHEIMTQLSQDFYSFSIDLGQRPDYLNDDESYFSYDGHYFYDSFYKMIDDYRNQSYEQAINPGEPYFNYYQYLPHRSMTNYTYDEIENYFYDTLCFDRKLQSYVDLNLDKANDSVNESQYYGELKSFFEYQNIYGANALMMLSISMHESSYGKSLNAFSNNNLFGHAAFDSEQERNNSRYNSLENSVYSHAKYYISSRFANHLSASYNGSFFGNKGSGMNVYYSNDPYWGEKAASNYWHFDELLGFKDYNAYALGIVLDNPKVTIYEDKDLSEVKTNLDNLKNYSFIILEKLDDSYKVQFDTSNDRNTFTYDFQKNYAYIAKDIIDILINDQNGFKKDYFNITFDSDGGLIAGQDILKVKVSSDQIPQINSVTKEGYEWIGFDSELTLASEDKKYLALYKKIESVELIDDIPSIIEMGAPYNVRNGKLLVTYEDGSEKIVDITTDMIERYDTSNDGKQNVVINYHGVILECDVVISKNLSELRKGLKNDIDECIKTYQANGAYNLDELLKIKNNLAKLDYALSFEEIRILDEILIKALDERYCILANPYDLSISGFGLSLEQSESNNNIFPTIYYAQISEISNPSRFRLINVSKAYGFREVFSFRLDFKQNLEYVDTINPFLAQIKIDKDDNQNQLYSVYRLDDDGNVYKCRSSQTSNYVQFMSDEAGDFMLLAMDSQNTYDLDDWQENINSLNSSDDLHGNFFAFMIVLVLGLLDLITYLNNERLKEKEVEKWNDYKKSLLNAEFVQEEKPKN